MLTLNPAPGEGGPHRWLPVFYALGTGLACGLALFLHATQGLAIGLAAAALIVALTTYFTHRLVSKRHRALSEIRTSIEELARGDTAHRLIPTQMGELAQTAASVNRVIDTFSGTRQRLDDLTGRLSALPLQVAHALESVKRSADDQEAAVEETAALQANINSSIRDIAEEVENLARANEESASSILELGSAVEQVARSAVALQNTVESSTSSLHQVGQSIRTVAASSDSVQQVAEETAASITQMDRAIQEVGLHVRGASELTERVADSADEGTRAVASTIDGIAEIREVTQGARKALEGLAGRIGEIGDITTVIGAITDETNLLSLNAAIIAAQAGEHGKAFAVVADQVKELARRTSQSTKEIEGLIAAIQQQSQRAVDAMAAGIQAVEQGVKRSRLAGDALEVIREASRDASGRVAEIARAAEEQARNSKQVAEAARRTSEHVQEISHAMAEQSQATERLLENSTTSVEMVRQMTSATEEQRASGRYITSNIEAITEMIRSIQQNLRKHEKSSASVAETFMAILDHARQGAARLPELSGAIDELRTHAEAMRDEVARFRGRGGDADGAGADA